MDTTGQFWFATSMTLIALIVGSGLYISGYLGNWFGSSTADNVSGFIGTIITFLSNFLPFALFTYGFMSDIIHLEWRASIPGFAGLIAIILLKLVTTFAITLPSGNNVGTSWCTIPGLESFENPLFPMAFILTTSILFYYSIWTGHPGSPNMTVFASVFTGIILVQLISFSISGSCADYYYKIYNIKSVLPNLFGSIAIGAAVAGITYGATYGISKNNGADYNPFLRGPSSTGASGPGPTPTPGPGPIPVGPPKCADGSNAVKTPFGKWGCKTTGLTCPDGSTPFREGALLFCPPIGGVKQSSAQPSVGADGDIYVLADLYKNGQPVTDSLGK